VVYYVEYIYKLLDVRKRVFLDLRQYDFFLAVRFVKEQPGFNAAQAYSPFPLQTEVFELRRYLRVLIRCFLVTDLVLIII